MASPLDVNPFAPIDDRFEYDDVADDASDRYQKLCEIAAALNDLSPRAQGVYLADLHLTDEDYHWITRIRTRTTETNA